MTRVGKLERTLARTQVESVRASFDPKRVRAEWEGLGLDELRECHTAEAVLCVEGESKTVLLGHMPKASPGDILIGPMAEMVRGISREAASVKLGRAYTEGVREGLQRVMGDIARMYDLSLDEIAEDRQAMDSMRAVLDRKKKRAAAKAVQSVFRRAVPYLSTEEVHEMWSLAQVESVLKS